MTRIGYDAIYANNAPAGGDIYIGYVGGNWPDFVPMEKAHPGKRYVSVAINNREPAKCLDVEQFDATPEQAPGWVQDQRAAGDPLPWVYMNKNTWPTVRQQFAVQKVPEPLYWVAGYVASPPSLTLPPAIPAGAIGLQAYDYGPYDISFFADYIPGFDPAPVTPVAPVTITQQEADMLQDATIVRLKDSQEVWLVHLDSKTAFHIPTVTGLEGYMALGCKSLTVDKATLTAQLKAIGITAAIL